VVVASANDSKIYFEVVVPAGLVLLTTCATDVVSYLS